VSAIGFNYSQSHHDNAICDAGKQSLQKYGIILAFQKMSMFDEIRAKRDAIHAIAKGHKAEKFLAFGSCASREERPDSDVDFLVKFGERR